MNKINLVLVTITIIAAFFVGISIGTFDDFGLSGEELKEILSEIKTAPTLQSVQQPPQPSVPQIFTVSFDDDPVKGNPDAPVTVVEFSDFQCPFCSRFFEQTLPLIKENYIDTGKIKFVYKDLPLDKHSNAMSAHIAAGCADEQGKFWEYHDVLFQKQAEWHRIASSDLDIALSQFAVDLGMQAAIFESCMESQDIADEVNQDILEAARYGATGTPAFFIGNEKVGFIKVGGAQPYIVFRGAIDEQLFKTMVYVPEKDHELAELETELEKRMQKEMLNTKEPSSVEIITDCHNHLGDFQDPNDYGYLEYTIQSRNFDSISHSLTLEIVDETWEGNKINSKIIEFGILEPGELKTINGIMTLSSMSANSCIVNLIEVR